MAPGNTVRRMEAEGDSAILSATLCRETFCPATHVVTLTSTEPNALPAMTHTPSWTHYSHMRSVSRIMLAECVGICVTCWTGSLNHEGLTSQIT